MPTEQTNFNLMTAAHERAIGRIRSASGVVLVARAIASPGNVGMGEGESHGGNSVEHGPGEHGPAGRQANGLGPGTVAMRSPHPPSTPSINQD